ncbi:MAG: DNA replication and repair protein RecF [Elusimicrobia bacterium]|nr:DNA replication and repair protein RecF [Elusimicrobiota bacterium]
MLLKKLKLVNFRNYKNRDFNFSDGINIITGKNGVGKTNILESIFLLSTSTSHKTNLKKYLVNRDENGFAVIARLQENKVKYNFEVKYSGNLNYLTSINASSVKRDEFLKNFPVILFSPKDIEIIGGSPAGIRRMLNINIAQTYPEYADALRRYSRALKERNALLKDLDRIDEKNRIFLKSFTDTLKKEAAPIIRKRKLFIEKINQIIKIESDDMNLKNDFKIDYSISAYSGNASDIKDIKYGYTTWGPQRDTFEFILNLNFIKDYGSRGEHKMAVILYKLALWNYIAKKRKVDPLILFDDVFGELDIDMRTKIKERIENVQSVITATEIPDVIGKKAKVIKI